MALGLKLDEVKRLVAKAQREHGSHLQVSRP